MCVCINCVYLFIVFFLECVGVLPFDGEIKMYIYKKNSIRYCNVQAVFTTTIRLRVGCGSTAVQLPFDFSQWLKWSVKQGGGLTWRSQVGANPIPIPHPTNLALFGHKITLYGFNQGAHTIAGGSDVRARTKYVTYCALAVLVTDDQDHKIREVYIYQNQTCYTSGFW